MLLFTHDNLMLSILVIIQAIGVGILEFGFQLAYLQREYPNLAHYDRYKDLRRSVVSGGLGFIGGLPVFLLGIVLMPRFYSRGLQWKV